MKHLLTLCMAAVLLLGSVSCSRYVVHPGAVNTFDSVTYDGLVAAKAIIDDARTQYQKGKLPPALVPITNSLATAYDIAYPAWQDWRAAAATPEADQKLAALQAALAVLTQAETDFKNFKAGVK